MDAAARSIEPFRRLIIYHSGLLPDSSGGMDESASLEELCEHILYYFDGTTSGGLSDDEPRREDAVKFVGLVSALHSLPLSLDNAVHSSDDETEREPISTNTTSTCDTASYTNQVHFSNSTLVFIPLEEQYSNSRGLVAVAQLPRAGQGSDSSDSIASASCGDPVAIRAMIRRKHAMFCLFNGGSVHHRLMALDQSHIEATSNATDENDNDEQPSSKVDDKEIECKDAAIAAAAAEDAAWTERWADSANGDNSRLSRQGGGHEAMAFLRQQNISHAHASGNDRNATNDYPGMSQLYACRKKFRKLKEQATRSRIDAELYDQGSADSEERLRNLEKKLTMAQEEVDALLRILPLSSIRAALESFYDEMIVNASYKLSLAGECVGRCIVDLVPAPGPSCPLRSSYPPCDPPPSTAAGLSRFMRSLLSKSSRHGRSLRNVEAINAESDIVPVLAITSFYRGRLLCSNIAHEGDDVCSIDLSTETVSLIYQHLCHNRMSMGILHTEENSNVTCIDNTDIDETNRSRKGAYMSPPLMPISKDATPSGTAEKTVESLTIESLGDIWMPRAVLPLFAQGDNTTKVVGEKAARVALFESNDYDFVVLVNGAGVSMMDAENTSISTVQKGQLPRLHASKTVEAALVSLAKQLQDKLQHVCVDVSTRPRLTAGMQDEEARGEAGVHMIFIDRLTNELILFNNGLPVTGPVQHGRSVGANEANPDGHTDRNNVAHDCSSFLAHCEDELDCRHLLASHLPLDIVLALDEMMKDIRQSHTESSVDDSRVIEHCTFLPQGWVYCRAAMHREMYAVFDPNMFVTLADVQKKALQIRKDLGLSLL